MADNGHSDVGSVHRSASRIRSNRQEGEPCGDGGILKGEAGQNAGRAVDGKLFGCYKLPDNLRGRRVGGILKERKQIRGLNKVARRRKREQLSER